MNAEKRNFLQKQLVPAIAQIPSDRPPLWGKMTLQQMVEHFAESVRIASGRLVIKETFTPEEHLSKMRDFLASDKPFRENTVNPLMPKIPAPVKTASMAKALQDLDEEITYFFEYFSRHPNNTTRNPFYADLNFDQNVQLLYKHALHHLKQFGA
jgi:hypothetical protein